mmetsp:Transcript_30702/g.63483  ORF Transcript_30702/g.63483 Transcript_30702/m.63483 type:complete len:220 (-) Transcript_30702:2088-2747(-)
MGVATFVWEVVFRSDVEVELTDEGSLAVAVRGFPRENIRLRHHCTVSVGRIGGVKLASITVLLSIFVGRLGHIPRRVIPRETGSDFFVVPAVQVGLPLQVLARPRPHTCFLQLVVRDPNLTRVPCECPRVSFCQIPQDQLLLLARHDGRQVPGPVTFGSWILCLASVLRIDPRGRQAILQIVEMEALHGSDVLSATVHGLHLDHSRISRNPSAVRRTVG